MADLLHSHQEAIYWIASISMIVFVGSLIIVPWIVLKIPADHFAAESRPKSRFADHHPVLRWTTLAIKNLLGVVLVVAGIAMLILPGQGILTIVVGFLMLDFPGKYNLERKIVRTRPILKSINWMRRKADVNPLNMPQETGDRCAAGD